MFKNIKYILFIILSLIILLGACFRVEKIPKEPRIEFREFIFKDSVGFNHILNGTLRFYFEDGDGNIGFGIDTVSKNTVFIEKYKIENNIPVRIHFNEDIANYKIKVFSTSGNRKALKGDIVIKSLDEVFPFNADDTIMYKFFIWDRDFNRSNIDSTGYLVLKNYIN